MDRTQAVMAGETPISMPSGPKLICHLVPLESFSTRLSISIAELQEMSKHLWPLGFGSGMSNRVNIDGIATTPGGSANEETSSYVQLYRTGIIEVVYSQVTYQNKEGSSVYLATENYERTMLESLPGYLKCQAGLGLSPPVWLFLTITGVKGASISVRHDYDYKPPIDRDTLFLPDAEISDLAVDAKEILRPLFDVIWNAAGFLNCVNFDGEGNWNAPQ